MARPVMKCVCECRTLLPIDAFLAGGESEKESRKQGRKIIGQGWFVELRGTETVKLEERRVERRKLLSIGATYMREAILLLKLAGAKKNKANMNELTQTRQKHLPYICTYTHRRSDAIPQRRIHWAASALKLNVRS